MDRIGEAEAEAEAEEPPPATPSSSSGTKVRVRRGTDPFLVVCGCFKFLTSLAALLCIAANVLSAIRCFKNGSDIVAGIFRCYAVVIASFVVLAETEWNFVIKFWKVFEYWVGRGMLQIFVAVMTNAYTDYTGEKKVLVLLQDIASYMMLGCGAVYVIAGGLCIGFLKRSRQKTEVTKEQTIKDLEELEQRREELERLLITERV